MNLWLDDVRDPARFGFIGWTWVKTVPEAIAALQTGAVKAASLDHDLGCCDDCRNGMTDEEWLERNRYQSMPNCEHFGTGYTLILWMEEAGVWPSDSIRVHSANPAGKARMEQAVRSALRRGAFRGRILPR